MMGDGGEDSDLSSRLLLDAAAADGFEDLLRTCTHTHTCNPPGPAAAAHTHTCYHTHTQLLSQDRDGPRRPLGNREAVRKYREKKKAHAAFLEEEVRKLRLANQQLLRRLQGQAALEAELLRLRALLAGLRGKIDTELGAFPYQKQCATATGLRCDARASAWGGGCVPAVDPGSCMGNDDGANAMDAVGSFIASECGAE